MITTLDLVTPLYAALTGLFFVTLSVRTLLLRRKAGVAIGSGENAKLARAIRAHGNCAEYLPVALILLLLAELSGLDSPFVHALGSLLLAGRVLHAIGISNTREDFRFRVAGMAMTFTVLISAALFLLGYSTLFGA